LDLGPGRWPHPAGSHHVVEVGAAAPGARRLGRPRQPLGGNLLSQLKILPQRLDVGGKVAPEPARTQTALGGSTLELGQAPAQPLGGIAGRQAGRKPRQPVGHQLPHRVHGSRRVCGRMDLSEVVQWPVLVGADHAQQPPLGQRLDVATVDAGNAGALGGTVGANARMLADRGDDLGHPVCQRLDQRRRPAPSVQVGAGISPSVRARSTCQARRPSRSANWIGP
jgi:hypothetical protein